MTIRKKCFLLRMIALYALMSWAHAASLNENCVVSILNRNVQVRADGTWVLPNLPANFGNVRARATCVEAGVTTYGESAVFRILGNGAVTLPPILLGPTTPIPTSLNVTVPAEVLTTAGATTQVRAQASYADGSEVDVTHGNTEYRTSNPDIATVSPTGRITGLRSGTVMIQATNEGAQGITQLRVMLSGADTDGDGIPDEVEQQYGTNPNNAGDALLDVDRDGLTALDEYRAGTDPGNRDSDGDGISDGDELRCVSGFCTSPLLVDTDGDGVRDGTEIRTGSDPSNSGSVNLASVVQSISVKPGNFVLVSDPVSGVASVQLVVTGKTVDGIELDLTGTTRQTRYTTSNPQSCKMGSLPGRLYGGQAGTCEITVDNNGHTATVHGTVMQDFTPAAISYVDVPGFANAIAIKKDFAYIAAGEAGLQVVGLTLDRRKPSIVAGLDLSASANDISIVGDIAYIATSDGLRVVDIAAPAAPQLLGAFAGIDNVMGIKVLGTTAYVASRAGLHILSVTDPKAVKLLGAITLEGVGWNLDIDPASHLAAVAMGIGGLQLVDVSHHTDPQLLGTAATGDARAVALSGSAAIVADDRNGLTSVDVSKAGEPVIVTSIQSNAGAMRNSIALFGNFAIGGSGDFFANRVSIVDISDPSELRLRFTMDIVERNDNGIGIAADANFAYLLTTRGPWVRGGRIGESRLYIGQYKFLEDHVGRSPTVTVDTPANGTHVYEGAQLTVSATAKDDLTVASVRFYVNDRLAFVTTSAPYRYTFTAPKGSTGLTLGVVAVDMGGNEGTATPVFVAVSPDPLTQVVGEVVGLQGAPLANVLVTAQSGQSATTDADGRFEIAGVPTVSGQVIVSASYTAADGIPRNGTSLRVEPLPGQHTDVGRVVVVDAHFEPDYGKHWTNCDDCYTKRTLSFQFPFYGTIQNIVNVVTNGFIEFGENIPRLLWFKSGVSVLDADLKGGGGVWINDSLPGRFIVTYDKMDQWAFSGSLRASNTAQIQLFSDGRLVLAYKGVTYRYPGVGISPVGGAPTRYVDYSANPVLTLPDGTSMLERFGAPTSFDLDNGLIVFTPAGSGYEVRTLTQPQPTSSISLTGMAKPAEPRAGPSALRASAMRQNAPAMQSSLGNAEVYVRSSSNPGYIGMTNTDSSGHFKLEGVPSGVVSVEIWRNRKLLAQGAGISDAEHLVKDALRIELAPVEVEQKTTELKYEP